MWLGCVFLVCGVFVRFVALFCCFVLSCLFGVLVGLVALPFIHPGFLHTKVMKLQMVIVIVKWALDLTLETYCLWCFR